MAPRPLTGRYQLYKAGTSKLINWLASTASRCCDISTIIKSIRGIDNTNAKPGKPLNKGRDLETLELSTQELVKLAEAIVSTKPPVDIPDDVIQIAKNVISGREECSAWYAGQALQPGSDVQRQNETHRYFIMVLQRILDLLADAKSKLKATAKQAMSSRSGKKKAKHFTPVSKEEELSNMFSALEVEEPFEIMLETQTPTSAPSAKKVNFKLQKKQDDAAFQIWCFLQDLADVRQYVKETWLEYIHGQISFLVASSVTDTAFGLLRCAEEEFIETSSLKQSGYNALLDFFGLTSFARGNVIWLCPKKPGAQPKNQQPDINVAELLCPIAHRAILNYRWDIGDHCQAAAAGRRGEKVVSQPTKGWYGWHAFCPVLRDLTPQLHDIAHRSTCCHILVDDFVQGLVECHRQENVPMWVVVACQIYMDIYDMLGDHAQHGANAIKTTLSKYHQLVVEVCKHTLKYADVMDDVPGGIRELVAAASADNRFEDQDSKRWLNSVYDEAGLLAEFRRLFKKDIKAGASPEHGASLMERLLPAHAGAMLVDLAVSMHRVGCRLANHGGIVLAAAHLYKYLRAVGLTNADWHDMDFVLASNKQTLVSKLRTDADELAASRHFLMALGAPANTALQASRGQDPQHFTPTEPRRIETHSHLLDALADRESSYTPRDGHHTKSKTIERVLHAMTASPGTTAQRGKHVEQERFTPVQLLKTFKKSMQAAEPGLSFDYTSFMMTCTDLLTAISESSRSKLPGLMPQPRCPGAHLDLTARLLRTSAASPALIAAANNLNSHIEASGRKFSKQAYDQSSGRIPKHLRPKIETHMAVYDLDRDMTSLILDSAGTKYTFTGSSLSAYHPEIVSETCHNPDCKHGAACGADRETDPENLVHRVLAPVVAFGSAFPLGIIKACRLAMKREPGKWERDIRGVVERMSVRVGKGKLSHGKFLRTTETMVMLLLDGLGKGGD